MVIIGAGHCGGRAAQRLREQGWTGRIDLVGDEAHPPYERPPLSKDLLTARKAAEDCWLMAPQALCDMDVTVHTARAQSLDTLARSVTLADGQVLPYARVLLATGGQVRRLSIPGADLPQVLTLRNLGDAQALASRLQTGSRLLVVGGGFIGLEVAASARQLGVEVVLVEGAARLLGRAVPPEVAAQVLDLHRAHGVDVRLGVLPTAFASDGDALRVTLADGSVCEVDTVVVGIGIEPAVELARQAGLQLGRGIVVDRQLRTSDPHVFAAGDVAEFPSVLSGQPMRQETWLNAETQSAVAADNMLGAAVEYSQLPWFWSDQYDHQLQVSGEPTLGVATALRDLGQGDHILFYLDAAQRVVGMSAWGLSARTAKEFKLARTLVERGSHATPAALADPAVKLKSLF